MKSKIGIILCGTENNRQFVTDTYVHAVQSTGGLPLVLPLVKSNLAIEEYISICDGFLFCGGGDITPLLYKQNPENGLGKTDLSLDIFQIKCMKTALKSRKPVFAICRGMQILNVACGGSLFQDLSPDDDCMNHMQTSQTRKDISHKVYVRANTKLRKITGPVLYTNSYHHQAVDQLGEHLLVSAKTKDGIVEAIEMPSHPFVLGVQWHPESMFEKASSKQLFSSFVEYTK